MKKKASVTLHILVEKDPESGWLVATCPELPGCMTQAENDADLQKNIKEAVKLWFYAQNEKVEMERHQCPLPSTLEVQELALSF
jgi:predicted RNase H-like HicB family nuclease